MGGHRRTILVVGVEDGLGLPGVATAVHRQTSRHHVLLRRALLIFFRPRCDAFLSRSRPSSVACCDDSHFGVLR